ncbi:hypothetical protein ACKWTF_010206 [Chironomus riparius]
MMEIANNHTTELDNKPQSNDLKMSHVQAVTVLEASQQSDKKHLVNSNNVNGKINNITKRNAYKDTNNNEQQITKESLNVTPTDSEEPQEYSLLGLVTFKSPIKWLNSVSIILIHLIFVYAFLTYPLQGGFITTIWGFIVGGIGGFGVTGGAHRFWCHRSYKANVPLRTILMLCYCTAGQNTLYDWVRDHRVHHKYSETDADPHNSNRGFFFAHVGWLMLQKHPQVLKKGRAIDMSDVLADPVIQFHQKYFIPLKIICCFIIPTIVPVYFWGESWYMAFMSQSVIRYLFSLNFTWLVNSAAHMWGYKPYDNRINPVENVAVAVVAMGEGWHNYHHVFPWDYKAAELGDYKLNITTMWIDFFAKIGWAWDLKEPSSDLIRRTVEKHGTVNLILRFFFGFLSIFSLNQVTDLIQHTDIQRMFSLITVQLR